MNNYGASSMRRLKPAIIALGAAAAIPAVILLTNPKLEDSDDTEFIRHRTQARHQIWKEDAQGFIQSLASRLSSLGSLGAKEDTPIESIPLPPVPQGEALEEHLNLKHLGLDPPTSILAKQFATQIAEICRRAEDVYGAALPSVRFTDCELMRYAIHHGFLRARDEAGRQRALHHSALAAAETAAWLERYPFASDSELQRFSHLVWWTQTAPEARAVLHVNIGKAVYECRGPEAIAFANAVVSHVERAVRYRLKDAPEGHDRVDVIVYAAGTSTLSASRAARVLRFVVTTLSHHYPGRLHELDLLDLPRVLQWLVKGAKKLVHKETAKKVVSMDSAGWRQNDIIDENELKNNEDNDD